MSAPAGRLAIVLHSHMPYVEGYGTWPFGEEWLWEAVATSYVPLLDVLEEGAPLTLSLTPVLCDQLEAPGVHARLLDFLDGIRAQTHAMDADGCRATGRGDLAAEVERASADYSRAADRLRELGEGGLLRALCEHATWTSAATHAVLPLVATDAGVRLQLRSGIESHRARTSHTWRGGFWLPECAHAPWIDPLLEEAGVHAVCADLTDLLGRGAPEHLRPIATEAGPLLVPIDRQTMELVWSEGGYPSDGAYRDYHHHTVHHHNPWANDGSVYDPERARARVDEHAADFVARVCERVSDGGLAVCALDTELLGHWWYEGVDWLRAVLASASAAGLAIVALDDALDGVEPAPPLGLERPVTTWGTPRDLSTWDGPAVAELAWRTRAAELRAVAAGPDAGERALRELLALQSSDWAFLMARDLAGDYPLRRFDAHESALDEALRGGATDDAGAAGVRGLAPHLAREALTAP